MLNGFAAALFLFLAIIFLGISFMTGSVMAWVMVLANGALFALNMTIYGQKAERSK